MLCLFQHICSSCITCIIPAMARLLDSKPEVIKLVKESAFSLNLKKKHNISIQTSPQTKEKLFWYIATALFIQNDFLISLFPLKVIFLWHALYLSSVYFTFETFRLEILFSFDDQSVNTFPILERFCRTILNWTKLCTLLDLARYSLIKHNNNREQGQVLRTILFSSIVRQNLSNVSC